MINIIQIEKQNLKFFKQNFFKQIKLELPSKLLIIKDKTNSFFELSLIEETSNYYLFSISESLPVGEYELLFVNGNEVIYNTIFKK